VNYNEILLKGQMVFGVDRGTGVLHYFIGRGIEHRKIFNKD